MRINRIGAAAAATLGTLGTLGVATLPSSSASVATGGTEARYVAHATHDTQVDNGAHGFSVGDQAIERGTLSQGGRTVGHYAMLAELLSLPGRHHPPTESQTFTLTLAHGSVQATLIHRAVDSFVLAVTGGTRAYRGAQGAVSVQTHGRRAVIELTLR